MITITGKFYDNHSLAIVNREIALGLNRKIPVQIKPLDRPDPKYKLDKNVVKELLEIETDYASDVEIRHSYPVIWDWPKDDNTKIIYLQPWEFSSIPSEWQYKFDTFADAIVTPSKWTAEVYKKSGINPSKIFVAPNGYDPNIFYNKDVRDTNIKTFLFVGCNQFRKGIDILLKAWISGTKHEDSAQLIIKDSPQIYGNTSLQQDIININYKTKCAPIHYIDSILSDAEMSGLYNKATYIVHPYRGEGFGMHLLEASKCGAIPIVTSGGPSDEFLDSSIRISTGKRIVNMYEIFALKAEDSMSNMGQHRWVLEPDIQHLTTIIRSAIDNKITPTSYAIENSYEWYNIIDSYIQAIEFCKNKQRPERVR